MTQATPVFLDTETTGVYPLVRAPYVEADPRVVSVAVVTAAGEVLGCQRVNPGVPIPAAATEVHGITDADVARCPTLAEVWPRLLARVGERALVAAHNAAYDRAVLAGELRRAGLALPPWRWACTLTTARRRIEGMRSYGLASLAAELELPPPTHGALSDARTASALGRVLSDRDPSWCEDADAWHPPPAARTVAVTGHRAITAADVATIARTVAEYPTCSWVFGGAIGVDTVALREARKAGLSHLCVVVPGTLADVSPEARAAIDECADEWVEMRGDVSRPEAYHARNRMLVAEASEVLAFIDGRRESSGTRWTAEYAREQGRALRVVAIEGRAGR